MREWFEEFIEDCINEGMSAEQAVRDFKFFHYDREFHDGVVLDCSAGEDTIEVFYGAGAYHKTPVTYSAYGWSPSEEWWDIEDSIIFDYRREN